MKLTDRELANVLLGLRSLQDAHEWGYVHLFESHPSLDGHEVMSPAELDALCDRLNPPVEQPQVPTVGTGELVILGGSVPASWVNRTVDRLAQRDDLREEIQYDALDKRRVRVLPLDEDEPVFSAQQHNDNPSLYHVAALDGLIPDDKLPQ